MARALAKTGHTTPATGVSLSGSNENRRTVPWYPFLFSLYPVLFLYLRNIREVHWIDGLWAAAVSLGMALALWPCTRFFATEAEKRALALFLFLLLFHSYGLFYDPAAGLLPLETPPLAAYALAFVLPGGAWILLTAVLLRTRSSLALIGRILRAAVVFLVAWNLAGILLHHGRDLWTQVRQPAREGRMEAGKCAGGPDIYCFVLDEFAAIETARSLFHYDNSAFVDRLRRLGFFVARDSNSPFLKTEQALASFLNLNDSKGPGDPFQRIQRNMVATFLKGRGYRIIEFPAVEAMFMEAADYRYYHSLKRDSIFFNDFYRTLLEHTLLRFLPDRWSHKSPNASRYYREQILQVFEELPGAMKFPGPKFVFVHLYCPHEPFVFNAQGNPAAEGHLWDHADPSYYLQQYIFISNKMVETVMAILADSTRPPVIVIQSDHGYRGSRGRKKWVRKVDDAEATKVFNALYLPGVPPDTIDPSLSPLNNFRLIFNRCFGTRYPLLPDH